jgi:Ca2+-binding RTX toxin-like protein
VGEDGDDELWGGTEADRAYGGAGNDLLVGEEGDDGLFGGGDDDRLFGGLGADVLAGEAGRDRLVARRATTGCPAARARTCSCSTASPTWT